ncbi:putative methionyl-tRNA synthetase [Tripterygium wilfordii]|uniref:Putative methionyl-tRNA synthetase n=2 Tax=Tripterygium wilfordii TaxID=458696 RepID=A0A7J7CIS4_TRIWF|nr:putative methionyl-tRNA synthetase [Tripterygium wilfordii]
MTFGASVLRVSGGARSNMLHYSSSLSTHIPLPRSYLYLTNGRTRGRRTAAIASVRTFCSSDNTTSATTDAAVVDGEIANNSCSIKDAGNVLDLRVGRIVRAWKHEEADSLYVEEVDIGEAEPRVICSGLVKYIPIHLLQDKKVVVLANLKPRNMRGVKSSGMLMAASDAAHETVELLEPPESSAPGERIWFGSPEDEDHLPTPATPNQISKRKVWEMVQPHLKSDATCNAMLGEHYMRTSVGVVVCPSLKNANIS